MLKSSRHPYQPTTLPHANFPVRNPWVEKIETSTNSSCGSRSGHTAKSCTLPQPTTSELLLPGNQTLSQLGPLLNQQVHPVIVPTQGSGSTSIAQGSSGGISVNGRIGSCGGQCVACETFCYYCLQVIFIAGILTGIALTIAGSVLHESQREGDLVVLLYIGVLLVLVCILLLSVHCCVRRNVKERKRALRMTLMEGVRHETPCEFTPIPVQDSAYDPAFGNYYAETNMNDYDSRENPRPLLSAIPNANLHYTSRVPSNRMGSMRVYPYERSSHRTQVHQPFEWGMNPETGGNRILRR